MVPRASTSAQKLCAPRSGDLDRGAAPRTCAAPRRPSVSKVWMPRRGVRISAQHHKTMAVPRSRAATRVSHETEHARDAWDSESCGRPEGRVARRQVGAARLPTHAAPGRDARFGLGSGANFKPARPRRLSLCPGGRASMARAGHVSSAPRGGTTRTGAGLAIRVRSDTPPSSRPGRIRTRRPGLAELRQ